MRVGHPLVAINVNERPYKPVVPEFCMNPEGVSTPISRTSIIRICVSETGTVTDVTILEPSIPFLDKQLPVVVRRWRFRPLLLDGRPTPFCYPLRYTVKQ